MKRLDYNFVKNICIIEDNGDIDKRDYHLKENLYFASMALIQCPYDCKVNIRESLAGWYVFVDFIDKDGKNTIYMVNNLEMSEGVYSKFCDAIGI